MINKLAAFPHFIFAIILSLLFFISCKSSITTEIILQKPTSEQQKDLDNYLNILSHRAKNCGIDISSTSVNSEGNLHIVCKGGDTKTIQKLLFKQKIDFNLMEVLDESDIWQFLQDIDMTKVRFDTGEYHGNKYDSIVSYLKIEIDNMHWAPIFGFALPADTNYVSAILDSLMESRYGKDYCEAIWGLPLKIDSLRLPLYLLKKNENNPFEKNASFIQSTNVSPNTMNGQPEIMLRFKKSYIDDWARMTDHLKGEYLAIILNDKVYAVPRVNEKIDSGRCSIGGNISEEEANMIAALLISESLPFELKIISAHQD